MPASTMGNSWVVSRICDCRVVLEITMNAGQFFAQALTPGLTSQSAATFFAVSPSQRAKRQDWRLLADGARMAVSTSSVSTSWAMGFSR